MAESFDKPALTTMFDAGRPKSRRLRKAKLIVISGPDQGREIDMAKVRVSGGRSIINDLVLTDKAVSGTHFEVVSAEDGYRLCDVGSTNGTFIGALKVKEVFLEPGAVFRLGHTEVRFTPTTETVEIALSKGNRFGKMVGGSVPMRELFALLERVAPTDSTILITGETGTGKEMVARGVHDESTRRQKPFVVLDCSAIPSELIESTLFGHEKGAFTGAISLQRGVFEQANGGTLFLDEIGELDLGLQPKLLRALERREFKRVGGQQTIAFDARVIAATNRDLRQMVNAKTFREDLYFRLSVITCHLPPLRERPEDIGELVQTFLEAFGGSQGPRVVAPDALDYLVSYRWPGNVRELRNVIERASALAESSTITRRDLAVGREGSPPPVPDMPTALPVPSGLDFKTAKQRVVDQFERGYLRELLGRHHGNISKSAREAGLTRYHLRELLKHHNLVAADEE